MKAVRDLSSERRKKNTAFTFGNKCIALTNIGETFLIFSNWIKKAIPREVCKVKI